EDTGRGGPPRTKEAPLPVVSPPPKEETGISTTLSAPAPGSEPPKVKEPAERPRIKAAPKELIEIDPGRYEIKGELGRGGLGKVRRAHETRLSRQVAVKEVLTTRGVAKARFLREALLTARLQHPSIVPIYEAGQWPDGKPFYSMKLVQGKPLDQIIQETR